MSFISDLTIRNLSTGTADVKKLNADMYIYTGYTCISGLITVCSLEKVINFEYLIDNKIYKKNLQFLKITDAQKM